MKSIKPGRGPSMFSGVMSIFMGLFGLFWSIMALTLGAGPFALFGLIFIGIAVYSAIYNFKMPPPRIAIPPMILSIPKKNLIRLTSALAVLPLRIPTAPILPTALTAAPRSQKNLNSVRNAARNYRNKKAPIAMGAFLFQI